MNEKRMKIEKVEDKRTTQTYYIKTIAGAKIETGSLPRRGETHADLVAVICK